MHTGVHWPRGVNMGTRQLIRAENKGCQLRDGIIGERDRQISRILYMYEWRLINVWNCQYHSFIRPSPRNQRNMTMAPMGKSMVVSSHLINPDTSVRDELCRLTWVCRGGDESWVGGDWRAHQGGGVRVGTQHGAQVADHLRVGTRGTGRTQGDQSRQVLSSQCLGTDHNNSYYGDRPQ